MTSLAATKFWRSCDSVDHQFNKVKQTVADPYASQEERIQNLKLLLINIDQLTGIIDTYQPENVLRKWYWKELTKIVILSVTTLLSVSSSGVNGYDTIAMNDADCDRPIPSLVMTTLVTVALAVMTIVLALFDVRKIKAKSEQERMTREKVQNIQTIRNVSFSIQKVLALSPEDEARRTEYINECAFHLEKLPTSYLEDHKAFGELIGGLAAQAPPDDVLKKRLSALKDKTEAKTHLSAAAAAAPAHEAKGSFIKFLHGHHADSAPAGMGIPTTPHASMTSLLQPISPRDIIPIMDECQLWKEVEDILGRVMENITYCGVLLTRPESLSRPSPHRELYIEPTD